MVDVGNILRFVQNLKIGKCSQIFSYPKMNICRISNVVAANIFTVIRIGWRELCDYEMLHEILIYI